jgi:hypothetical protein
VILTKILKTVSIANMTRNQAIHRQYFSLKIVNFLSWSFLFAVIYAQAPLFTSNQNQYFLHGLARAGYGFLSQDWLANTVDPTPAFSFLVEWVWNLFHSGIAYYLIYATLMGVYLWSVLGIVDQIYGIKRSRVRMMIFLALFLGVHSAAWRYLLSRLISPDWSYVFEGGVAGQRLLGSVLQPSVFGVLLITSIDQFLHGRTGWALIAIAAAVTFHPTYLLSAAMLTLAYMWDAYRETRQVQQPLGVGFTSFALVLPVVIYVWVSFGMSSSEYVVRAREILVDIRIPHHAEVAMWFNSSVILQVVLVGLALWLTQKTRLFRILLVGFSLAVVLTGMQVLSHSDALALLFPWRISSVLVPLSTAILTGYLVSKVSDHLEPRLARGLNALTIGMGAIVMVLALLGATRFILDLESKSTGPEAALFDYVSRHRQSGDVYLVPTKMQDFRLATGAPIYVDFKSIPYAQSEILEWRRRDLRAGRFYREKDEACQVLESFAEEGVTRVVLESRDSIQDCQDLEEVYQDPNYGVYAITVMN